jgi:hypothetical protein
MVKLELEKIQLEDGKNTLDVADLCKICLNATKQGGFTVDEMRSRIKIMDKLETDKKTVELEDAEYKTLRGVVKTHKWGAISRKVVEFVDYIDGLK